MLYFIAPRGLKNTVLLLSSLFFYGWGEPRHIVWMAVAIIMAYLFGLLIERFREKDKISKLLLTLSASGSLAMLGYFKYGDFLIGNFNEMTGLSVPLLRMALPIGISFYTFQILSYTVDIYRGKVAAQRNLIDFAAYVAFFPQLIAGPIVRYKWIEPQLEGRVVTEERWVKGMHRFLIGLGKKVIFANQIGNLWIDISGGNLSTLSTLGAWIGAFAYTFQIYFDFSGYSDMAIGLGQMFGFTFPENFIYPYEAKNITDFWRRWHITLGAWFREYIYIPLGGNRRGLQRQLANLFVVWLLTGLWHGASWNFALWGIYFFVLLVAEKVFLLKEMEHWPQVMRHIYGKFFIVVGWVLFAIEDFDNMGYYLQVMFGIKNSLVNEAAGYYLQTYGILLVIMAVASTRIPIRLMNRLRRYLVREEPEFAVKKGKSVEFVLYSLYTFIILLISIGMLISGSYNPFLYFRF